MRAGLPRLQSQCAVEGCDRLIKMPVRRKDVAQGHRQPVGDAEPAFRLGQ